MNHKIGLICLSILFLFTVNIRAQSSQLMSVGNAGIAQNGTFGVMLNPASLVDQTATIGIDGLNLFSIKELNRFSAMGLLPVQKFGTFGLNIQQFGFGDFRDQEARLSYARKLMSNLDIGVQGIYLNRSIDGYGSKQLFSASVGFITTLTSKIKVGAYLANPFPQEWNADDKLLPLMTVGINYVPSEKVDINLDVEKEFDAKVNGKLGVSYHPMELLDINFGVNTNPSLFSFGFGLNIKKSFTVNAAASYHQILGFSSGIGFSYHFQNNK